MRVLVTTLSMVAVLTLSGCSALTSLLFSEPQTPAAFSISRAVPVSQATSVPITPQQSVTAPAVAIQGPTATVTRVVGTLVDAQLNGQSITTDTRFCPQPFAQPGETIMFRKSVDHAQGEIAATSRQQWCPLDVL